MCCFIADIGFLVEDGSKMKSCVLVIVACDVVSMMIFGGFVVVMVLVAPC